MGFGWQELLIILVIVALIFGTKKLKNIGSDLGGAVKGFKDSMSSESSVEKNTLEEQKNKAEPKIDEKSTVKSENVEK